MSDLFLKVYVLFAMMLVPALVVYLNTMGSTNPIAMWYEKILRYIAWGMIVVGGIAVLILVLHRIWFGDFLAEVTG